MSNKIDTGRNQRKVVGIACAVFLVIEILRCNLDTKEIKRIDLTKYEVSPVQPCREDLDIVYRNLGVNTPVATNVPQTK